MATTISGTWKQIGRVEKNWDIVSTRVRDCQPNPARTRSGTRHHFLFVVVNPIARGEAIARVFRRNRKIQSESLKFSLLKSL